MMHTLPRAIPERDRDFGARTVFWSLAIAAAAAASLLLLLSLTSFGGFDRLLPDGQPFLPYFTT